MIASKEHHNKLLVSLSDGKKLGEIKGLYLPGGARSSYDRP